ncbi:metallophosphoesterase [Clostridiaceae bacterium UIB06]|uniref:Metallophosphoesterase n=1 Tax=Clostridium thailandense TaxID=2794346 RepID=A0A949U286_9CLOT|nr:metallophosphoesterase [Clostridium thailandense]MBV7276055.1 metallophosphoesterase [Clostridium thailandense]MCH5135840.1 metallophosphoesterase [Clostridiaceae bacterium UIB06]
MIYITGDTHIPNDIKKLDEHNFEEQMKMNKNDYLIICGDFGGIWNNSKEELQWRKWLSERKFTTLFIDGNHENFDLLNKYEIKKWNSGKVHFINESVIHLMRGQVYILDGLKFFTMGGAESIDKYNRVEGKSWWKEEMPSKSEYDEALDNLDKNNWNVDYVITHTASIELMQQMCWIKENNPLNSFFNMLQTDLNYKHWYFGHFHDDIDLDNKHTLLYEKIIRIK